MSDDSVPDLAPAPFTLDFLMSEDPLKLSSQDLDMIIQYHRNIRADRASGARRAKVSTAPAPKGVAALLRKVQPVVPRRGM
jgi:hypothetical protein